MRSEPGSSRSTPASQQPVVASLVLEHDEALPRPPRARCPEGRRAILELAGSRDAVAMGPDRLDDETAQVARGLVHELRQPMAVDADALTALPAISTCCRSPARAVSRRIPGDGADVGARVDESSATGSRPCEFRDAIALTSF